MEKMFSTVDNSDLIRESMKFINKNSTYLKNIVKIGVGEPKIKPDIKTIFSDILSIHYFPFNYWDTLDCIISRQRDEGLEPRPDTVFTELVGLFINDEISYAFISNVAHTLIHEGNVVMDKSACTGDIGKFIEKYQRYLTSSAVESAKENIRKCKKA